MFLFSVFSAIAIVSALGVISSRKPVYSALFLLLNFGTLAALYILLEAQFLAMVQIIVYAGAIVVLFLFVVMLIGGGEWTDVRPLRSLWRVHLTGPRLTALVLAVLLGATLVYGLLAGNLAPSQGSADAFGHGSVEALGAVLYTDYALPFELTSVLLLVGIIGAVVLARRDA